MSVRRVLNGCRESRRQIKLEKALNLPLVSDDGRVDSVAKKLFLAVFHHNRGQKILKKIAWALVYETFNQEEVVFGQQQLGTS